MRIAADIGFGHVKALDDSGGRISFPSVIAPEEYDDALDEVVGSKRRSKRVSVIPDDGRRATWLFGATALGAPGATRPWSSNVTQREGYDVLVYAAIGSLLQYDTQIELVLGLPLGVFGNQKDALRREFEGKETTIAVGDRPPMKIRITRVVVLPQAAGAYYAAALTPEGSIKDPAILQRPTGVIDVGFRTTDYFVMQRDDEGLHPVKALSGSLDVGVVEVYEGLRRRAQNVTGGLIDSLEVEAALRHQDGKLYHMGRELDLSLWLDDEAERVARRVKDELRIVWGKHLAGLGAVLLAGGGAIPMGPNFRSLHPALRVVEDPSFANAAGFLAVFLMREKSARAQAARE